MAISLSPVIVRRGARGHPADVTGCIFIGAECTSRLEWPRATRNLMIDYPKTEQEFEESFATERACAEYLARLKWPEGFRCPRCGNSRGWPKGTEMVRCSACDYHASITAGTIFHRTRKSLRLWFRAMWCLCNLEMALVLSHCTGFSVWEVTRLRGRGCRNSGVRWYVWTRPLWEDVSRLAKST